MLVYILTCGVSTAKFRLPLSAGDSSGLGLTGWLGLATPEPTLIAFELSTTELADATLMKPTRMRQAVENIAVCSIVRSAIPWMEDVFPRWAELFCGSSWARDASFIRARGCLRSRPSLRVTKSWMKFQSVVSWAVCLSVCSWVRLHEMPSDSHLSNTAYLIHINGEVSHLLREIWS